MEDANKKFYFDVISDHDVTSFFTKAAEDNKSAEVWKKGQDKEKVENFKVISFDEDTRALRLRFQTSGLLGALKSSQNIGKDVLFKIPFDNIYLFTNTNMSYDPEQDHYHAVLDRDVYKSQQRSNYRLEATKFIRLQFKIDDIVYEANDISAGGTSFTIDSSDIERYPKNTIFSDCKVKITKFTYEIPEARVASHSEFIYRDEFGNELVKTKIGVAFQNLPKKVEEELTITVNSEARGEEIRKLNMMKSQSGDKESPRRSLHL